MCAGRRSHWIAFVPTLLGNLVPLFGIVALGWRARTVLFIYWIELGAVVVCYSLAALVARQEPDVDDRTINPVTLSVPFVSGRSGTIRPVTWLPPIYYRNVQYAAGTLLWGAGFWLCLSALFLLFPSSESLNISRELNGVPVGQYLDAIAVPLTPGVIVATVSVVASQVSVLRSTFFARQVYERCSAPMVTEHPIRQLLVWFLLTGFAGLVFPLVVAPLVALFTTETVAEIGVATLVVTTKLTVEYARHRTQLGDTPPVLLRWFVPETVEAG